MGASRIVPPGGTSGTSARERDISTTFRLCTLLTLLLSVVRTMPFRPSVPAVIQTDRTPRCILPLAHSGRAFRRSPKCDLTRCCDTFVRGKQVQEIAENLSCSLTAGRTPQNWQPV